MKNYRLVTRKEENAVITSGPLQFRVTFEGDVIVTAKDAFHAQKRFLHSAQAYILRSVVVDAADLRVQQTVLVRAVRGAKST